MNNYPKFAQIKNEKYEINTDYKVALECDKITRQNINDTERALAIIYLLFGEKGLQNSYHWNELLKIALKYLRCGKEIIQDINGDKEEADMDIEQDWEYVRASFFYDYKIRLDEKTHLHWWEFYNLLCALSEKCILNRVRFIRGYDISELKGKDKEMWIKAKQQLALKKEIIKTDEQRRLDKLFEKQLKGE